MTLIVARVRVRVGVAMMLGDHVDEVLKAIDKNDLAIKSPSSHHQVTRDVKDDDFW
jgi:hypothetical protein